MNSEDRLIPVYLYPKQDKQLREHAVTEGTTIGNLMRKYIHEGLAKRKELEKSK